MKAEYNVIKKTNRREVSTYVGMTIEVSFPQPAKVLADIASRVVGKDTLFRYAV